MTNTIEQLTETLNDLVKINNDRVVGYEKAAEQAAPYAVDLQTLFVKMANESREYKRELEALIQRNGGEPSDDTTNSGKIYRVWMGVKKMFTGTDRATILDSCEFGEDAAQTAYKDALESDAEMSAEVRQLIMEQKTKLKESHDIIKRYRDLARAN